MPRRFHFADFDLDIDAYALRRAGTRIRLERVPMELLILLLEKAGSLVTRREIQSALWRADVFMEHDSGINTAVRKIRQALGDDAARPRFLETVVGKGYRFITPLERRRQDDSASPGGPPLAVYYVSRGRKEFVLGGGENLLGRDPDACVCIDHPSVSRRHARISIESGRAVLEDLASRNGTFVDGRRISAPTEIRHGMIVGLGPVALTFLVRSRPASTQPMSDDRAHQVDELVP